MTDNRGREIEAVYTIACGAGYCIYTVDASGEFVYTTYKWCRNFTKMTKNKVYCRKNGSFYIKKYGKRVNLEDFIKII